MEWTDKLVLYNQDADTKIAGLYDLQYTIGRGHYAVVKLARHVFTGEKVAVKVIDKTKLDDISRDHLFQEVVCMKLVQHPNVVRLYEVIDTPTKLYLILELGDGGDLYDYIINHGSGLSENVAKRYFRQIVTAIAYCHKLHVVHRDLKPENVVFFEKLGLVKLTDFGFSNKFIPGRHLDTACGSLAYSAPEILLGDSYDAPKVDIWSLGVILFMLVSGRLPFQETNDSETITKIMDCDYSFPPNISKECKQLISSLLIKDPKKRACLDDILQTDWLRLVDNDMPIELFSVPLISREHLSFEDHMEILTKMSEGKLATIEEIQSTLDANDYNHLAATYYLLAERKLKRNYIEEYKVLLMQSQLREKRKQQELQEQQQQLMQQQQIQKSDESLAVNTSKSTPNTPATTARILNTTVEERVRRFSMILEDVEEEANEDSHRFSRNKLCTEPITKDEIMANDTVATTTTTTTCGNNNNDDDMNNNNNNAGVYPSCLPETSDELLLEEQEEIATMVSLACVRSELLHEMQLNTNPSDESAENEHTQLPISSHTSGFGMGEVSDGTESDVSVGTWSTCGGGGGGGSGSSVANSLNRVSSTTRSLPPVIDNRRKHIHRRGLISHRPLITVKSSPQLLKHIAEEEWNNISADTLQTETPPGTSNQSNHHMNGDQLEKSPGDTVVNRKLVRQFTAEDDFRRRSLYNPHQMHCNIRYVDDQLIGLRPNGQFMQLTGQNLYSGTHSPAWARRYFTTPNSSRPSSSGSWNAAMCNLSLTSELQQRRLSHCSSPADYQTSTTTNHPISALSQRRKRLSHLNYSMQGQHHSQSYMLDRRCSGPPGLLLTLSGIYSLNTNVPLPSCSGSIEPLSMNDDDVDGGEQEDGDIVMIGDGDDASESVQFCDMALGNRDEKQNRLVKLLTKSPTRTAVNDSKTTNWHNSAPVLYDKSIEQNQNSESTSSSTRLNDSLLCINSLREHCTPIREEDEVSRIVDITSIDDTHNCKAFGQLNNDVDDDNDLMQKQNRRCSESSSLFGNLSNIGTFTYAPLGESESVSTINQLRDSKCNSFIDQLPSTGLNSSNFSLSSLATSLRGSRHMIDIIRSTFELQCYQQRKFANSLAGVNNQVNGLRRHHPQIDNQDYHYKNLITHRPLGIVDNVIVSTSNSVRSLTGIGDKHYFPLSQEQNLDRNTNSTTTTNIKTLRNYCLPSNNNNNNRKLHERMSLSSSTISSPSSMINAVTKFTDSRPNKSSSNKTVNLKQMQLLNSNGQITICMPKSKSIDTNNECGLCTPVSTQSPNRNQKQSGPCKSDLNVSRNVTTYSHPNQQSNNNHNDRSADEKVLQTSNLSDLYRQTTTVTLVDDWQNSSSSTKEYEQSVPKCRSKFSCCTIS